MYLTIYKINVATLATATSVSRVKVLYLSALLFNVNTFLKSVSTSKSRVTYDLDTDRVTYDLDTDTTTYKIIGVVGSLLYLATPVSTALPKSHLSLQLKTYSR